mmetsp:Transcript_1586/g.5073  ORF Transcript_1586/g.5073 Transcript_1586/m.5073 type:complete len:249 (+) Transcript_1586:242-988(+)
MRQRTCQPLEVPDMDPVCGRQRERGRGSGGPLVRLQAELAASAQMRAAAAGKAPIGGATPATAGWPQSPSAFSAGAVDRRAVLRGPSGRPDPWSWTTGAGTLPGRAAAAAGSLWWTRTARGRPAWASHRWAAWAGSEWGCPRRGRRPRPPHASASSPPAPRPLAWLAPQSRNDSSNRLHWNRRTPLRSCRAVSSRREPAPCTPRGCCPRWSCCSSCRRPCWRQGRSGSCWRPCPRCAALCPRLSRLWG